MHTIQKRLCRLRRQTWLYVLILICITALSHYSRTGPALKSENASDFKVVTPTQNLQNSFNSVRTVEEKPVLRKLDARLAQGYAKSVKTDDSDRILSPQMSEMINTFGDLRISGFDYCDNLDNAKFNPFVRIPAINGSLAQVNPLRKEFTKMVDEAARAFTNVLKGNRIHPESLQRLSCHSVVSGRLSLPYVLSQETLLLEVDSVKYFPYLSVTPSDILRKNTKERRHYKIAYLILAHDNKGNLLELLKHMYSEDAIFLIHIDGNYPQIEDDIRIIVERKYKKHGNVYVIKNPFKLQWGSPFIVMAQLEGFYQLLDLAEWDYAINLSAHDFPLMSTRAMHKKLQEEGGKSYINYWADYAQTISRLSTITFPTEDQKNLLTLVGDHFPNRLDKYPPYKHHQWMILSREFVELIRNSQQTYDLLAFMEYTMIPDESFFIMIALCPELNYRHKVVSDTKRYIYFLGDSPHPISLHDGDEDTITKHGIQYFFVRKVDALKEKKLVKWMLDRRDQIDRELGITQDEFNSIVRVE